MKNKKILVLLLAIVMVVSVVVFAGCSSDKVGVAYGLVHGLGYVGQATITVDGEGKIKAATLDEACFPSQVVLSVEEQAKLDKDDYSNFAGKHGATVGYKTVKFGTYTLVGDGITYKSGAKTIVELFADEVAAKAYFEAAKAGEVKAITKAGEVVLTAKQLLKSQNGYWGKPSEKQLGWQANVDATCAYVVANGFANITKLTLKDNSATNPKLENEWMDGTISTGATWVDMLGYCKLLESASKLAK
ncbi:MAG: hypothetical protein RR086_02260 [Clostridia bacterium]